MKLYKTKGDIYQSAAEEIEVLNQLNVYPTLVHEDFGELPSEEHSENSENIGDQDQELEEDYAFTSEITPEIKGTIIHTNTPL